VLLAPLALRYRPGGSPGSRAHAAVEQIGRALVKARDGLAVFRHPRLGAVAAGAQLSAWAIQCLSCYMLLRALGLDQKTGIAAAAGVLFAVNVTAVLPATPANLGVFQAACAAVLHAGWHIPLGTGVAYGVILQAVEVTTAVLMGMPALLREGMSWREVRMRAMHAAPVRLAARESDPRHSGTPVLGDGRSQA
jgi:phosphatidyl-myo-inositol alpha-mannosyltransferase